MESWSSPIISRPAEGRRQRRQRRRKKPRQRATMCALMLFCESSGVRFQMWHGGRWGREKADVGVEESETSGQSTSRTKRERGSRTAKRRGAWRLSVFPDATRSRYAREFPFLFFSPVSSSLSLSPSTVLSPSLLPLPLSLSVCLSSARALGHSPSSSLRPSSYYLSAITSRTTSRHVVWTCPAPSCRAWSGTNRSAASGNDGAPIGTRRRRIDADEWRF